MPSTPVKLGDPLPLSLAAFDGANGLYPQAHVYDASNVEVGSSPFDLSEIGTTGRYTSAAFTPTSTETYTALFITYTDALHTLESAIHARVQEMYPVDLPQVAASGATINTPANSDSTITTGSAVAGTYADTATLDGTPWQIDDDAGTLEMYFEFAISADGSPVSATMTGRVNGANDSLDIFAWNWGGSTWDQIGALSGQGGPADAPHTYNLFATHVGTGADLGKVRIRFYNTGLTGADLYVDQMFLSYAVITRSVGYADGAIWIDTVNGTAGTTAFINGTADNPVDTLADGRTLSIALGLRRFRVSSNSSITLAATYDAYAFVGDHWTLALGGQSIADAQIHGADVSGVCTAASAPHFVHCDFGAATLPPCHAITCGFEDTITLGGAGSYHFNECYSEGTATVDFAAVGSSFLNMPHYSGAITVANMGQVGADTMALQGHGQLIIAASCVGGTITKRGHFDHTDNASGAVTLLDDALTETWQRLGLDVANARVDEPTSIKVPADGSVIDVAIVAVGNVVIQTRQP